MSTPLFGAKSFESPKNVLVSVNPKSSPGVIDTNDTPFIEPGDDFGFTETSAFFGDGKEFAPNRGIDI